MKQGVEPRTAARVVAGVTSNPEIGQAERTRKTQTWRLSWPWWLFAALLGFLVLYPLVALQGKALSDGIGGFQRALALPGFGQTLVNTALLAVGSVIVAVLLGTLLAWFVVRSPQRIRGLLSILPVLPLVVPSVALVTGWIFLLAPRQGYLNAALRFVFQLSSERGPLDIYSITAIVLLTGFLLSSFVYLFVYSSLISQGGEFAAAAAMSGAGPFRTFRDVTVPLLRPAVIYASGIAFLLGLGQFTVPLLLGAPKGIKVLTTEMYIVREQFPPDYAMGAALGAPLVIAGVIVVFLQRIALGDQSRFVVVGGRRSSISVPGSKLAVVPVLAYTFFAVVLPLLAVTHVALSPYWSGSLTSPSDLTLSHFYTVLDSPRTITALVTSVTATLVALVIVVPIGFMAAVAMLRTSHVGGVARRVIDLLVTIPLGMPAAIFGFAVLYSFASPPFNLYGGTTIIILTYVILMIPHAMRPQHAALVAIGPEYVEAARVSGASSPRILLNILLPLTRRGIAAAASIVAILLVHEFAASLMVRSARIQVLGTLLYDYWTGGIYAHVAVVALLMSVLSGIAVVGAMAFGGYGSIGRNG